MRTGWLPVVLLGIALAACGGDDVEPAEPGVCTVDVRIAPRVYFGTDRPSYATLSDGQIQAIGAFTSPGSPEIYCSGTLIASTFALTADHCEVRVGDRFCVGDAAARGTCLTARAVASPPALRVGKTSVPLDLAVVTLDGDATARAPGLVPIPIAVEALDRLAGHRIETAGFGETERKSFGVRRFALERIDAVGPRDDEDGVGLLRVDGRGARGVCFGDSGGPALIVDGRGAARVAGALAWGDDSCVGRDRYTRVDVARAWIERITGQTPAAPAPTCGPIDAVGTCSGGRAHWCDAGQLVVDACDGTCGWDAAAGGFRCLRGPDPCGGEDAVGSCTDDVAQWCEDGALRSRDCGCLAMRCRIDPSIGATCR